MICYLTHPRPSGPDGPVADGTSVLATFGQDGVVHGDVHRYRGKCRVNDRTTRENGAGAEPCANE